MALSTQPYKGARDFYPEDMRLQKWLFSKWREVCELFGYEEYSGPIIEPLELFTSKTSDEIVNEQTYNFTDRGGRNVVLRPEMTPTVSRMVAAKRQELAYPLRLFSIVNCFRYERPQKGRTREFWQLNADLFGVAGIEAEVEMILLADGVMKAFGATDKMYEIRVNSRQLLDKRIQAAGLQVGVIPKDVISLVDKRDKMEPAAFREKLAVYVERPNDLIDYFDRDGATEDYEDIRQRLEAAGVANVAFVPSVARGFEYYTDIVFEVFDKDPDNNRSMFGGGRYDGLVGEFGVEPLPTVGFGMGDVTLLNFLSSHGLLPEPRAETEVYVIPIGVGLDKAQAITTELREMGVNVAVDITGNKLDKQIKTATKKGIRFALFVGQNELDDEQYALKDLVTGQEERRSLQRVVSAIKDYRK